MLLLCWISVLASIFRGDLGIMGGISAPWIIAEVMESTWALLIETTSTGALNWFIFNLEVYAIGSVPVTTVFKFCTFSALYVHFFYCFPMRAYRAGKQINIIVGVLVRFSFSYFGFNILFLFSSRICFSSNLWLSSSKRIDAWFSILDDLEEATYPERKETDLA